MSVFQADISHLILLDLFSDIFFQEFFLEFGWIVLKKKEQKLASPLFFFYVIGY